MSQLKITVNDSSRAGLIDLAIQSGAEYQMDSTSITLSGLSDWSQVQEAITTLHTTSTVEII